MGGCYPKLLEIHHEIYNFKPIALSPQMVKMLAWTKE